MTDTILTPTPSEAVQPIQQVMPVLPVVVAPKPEWTPRLLAFLIVIGFFGVLATLFLTTDEIPQSVSTTLSILLGALSAGMNTIIGYYFGSSQTSIHRPAVIETGEGKK